MRALRFLLFALLAAVSCSPKVVENIQYRDRVEYRDRVQVDTTFIKDSVFVRELIQGDTIRVTEYRDRYHYDYRYIDRVDTLIVVDSVAVEQVKEVKVSAPLTWWQKAKMQAFPWLLLVCVLLAAWTFRKTLIKLL